MKTLSYLFAIVVLSTISCKKDSNPGSNAPKPPTVTTAAVTAITATTAQGGGTVTADGGSPVTARGVCWDVVTPFITDEKTVDGSGIGAFTSSLTNLYPSNIYFVRAYATNSAGTAYGEAIMITALNIVTLPTVVTDPVTRLDHNSASLSGAVNADGDAPVTVRGFCWGIAQNPTLANNNIPLGTGLGSFYTNLTGLVINTTYYVRAYATNSAGTAYADQISFTTGYKIGNVYQGGKIFYVDNTKLHGLIAAETDQSAGAQWNNTSHPYVDVNAYSNTDGVANTNAMIATINSTGNAAAVCRAYRGGGYTDWYLPAINELHALFLQRNAFGNFQPYLYWSSTASTSYVASAWAKDFGSGTSFDDKDKTAPYWIRAIRRF